MEIGQSGFQLQTKRLDYYSLYISKMSNKFLKFGTPVAKRLV